MQSDSCGVVQCEIVVRVGCQWKRLRNTPMETSYKRTQEARCADCLGYSRSSAMSYGLTMSALGKYGDPWPTRVESVCARVRACMRPCVHVHVCVYACALVCACVCVCEGERKGWVRFPVKLCVLFVCSAHL